MLVGFVLLAGCNRQDNQGASDEGNLGRGTNVSGHVGGNGKIYDRGGGTNQTPGSGRIDQGGGLTTGFGTNSVTWTNANTGQTNPGPSSGPVPH
jgi:hypothetical protein